MKTKTEEVQELEILTPEQIKALSKETKDNVVFLTENMPTKDLVVLNPVVSELIKIRERGSKLKMKPINKDGEFDKDNIQEFIDVKKDIRTFRAEVGRTAKKLKIEPAKITKALIAIEKKFVEEATIVYDNAEKEFADYIAKEDEIKAEKQRKKDEALNAKVNEAKMHADEANLKLEKTNTYNKIKYEIIGESIKEAVNEAVLNANKNRLIELKESIEKSDYNDAVEGINNSVLDENVQAELKEYFSISKANSLKMLNERIKSIDTETENIVMKASQEKPVLEANTVQEGAKEIEKHIPGEVPLPPVPPTEALSDDDFIRFVKGEIRKLLDATILRLQTNPASAPRIYDLRNELSNIR